MGVLYRDVRLKWVCFTGMSALNGCDLQGLNNNMKISPTNLHIFTAPDHIFGKVSDLVDSTKK